MSDEEALEAIKSDILSLWDQQFKIRDKLEAESDKKAIKSLKRLLKESQKILTILDGQMTKLSIEVKNGL